MLASVAALALLALVMGLVGLVAYAATTARRVERLVPAAGNFVTVDGVRLHYVDEGEGPVLVMIHGLASQLQTFTYAMRRHLPGYRLVILDRPGAGHSQAGPAATLTAQADLVAAWLDRLGIDRALLVGHSLGGAVALAVAVRHPGRVAGLALVAPASQPQDEPPAAVRALAVRAPLARWAIGWTLAIPFGQLRRAQLLATLFAPDPVVADFATRGGHALTLRPWAFRCAACDLVEAGSELGAFAARYREIDRPVGILFGTGDRVLDPELHGRTLARAIADADLDLIDAAGHMLPLSHPERTAAFVERVATRAGLRASA